MLLIGRGVTAAWPNVAAITVSTYMILYAQPLYELLAPWLRIFERRQPFREVAAEAQAGSERTAQAIVFGLGRYGSRLFEQLRADSIDVIGVDFDPEAVHALQRRGLLVLFGDGEDSQGILQASRLPVTVVKHPDAGSAVA